MLNALTALILASNIVLHAPDDPACKNAPAGWIRGIARAVGKELGQEARAAPTAPKETVVALQAVVSHKFGFNPLGTLNPSPFAQTEHSLLRSRREKSNWWAWK